MTSNVLTANAGLSAGFRNFFKPRDIFLHDGKSLRRFTIGAKLQMAAAFAVFFLLAWSMAATYTALGAMSGDMARMERQVATMQADVAAMRVAVNNRAAQLERRQAFLATLLSSDPDADRLAALMPQAVAQPTNPAAQAMADSFDEVDEMQMAMVEQARAVTRMRYRETAAQLRRIGLNPAVIQRNSAMGGPYEPVTATADNADPAFRALFTSWRALDRLEQGVAGIPAAQPVQTSANLTSGYGIRSDPFRGRAAMHAGIDLSGPLGTPIYATADGVVGRSEWNSGGYGNLVEIDHGQGIQTRYGHLSRLIARPGQRVRRGELIGLMGSTGRSTGSHLHYEVRIEGRAVNPVPFMQPSQTLIALQRRTAVEAPVALGGPTGGPAGGSR
ncbi:MAG TPA: M23 family metallopeptidase [Allosphingosinicella sp.]|nr:M23 family metallopeptidase [Allosphingosinicella sp.]